MIERVHDHLTGELKQNARTDTIFVVTAVILNLVILAVNTSFAANEGERYQPQTVLTPEPHVLHVEVLSGEQWEWVRAGSFELQFGNDSSSGSGQAFFLPDRPMDIRFQIDGRDESGWAVASEAGRQSERDTVVMFIFVVLQVLINIAIVFGLMKGKHMRSTLLDGLLRMYRDQEVDAYYSESLLKNYIARYFTFVAIVIFLAVVSIIVPFVLRYM